MTTTLNINRLLPVTEAEGPGRRTCLWLQGCSRHCEGCFSPHTWDSTPHLLLSPADVIRQALDEGVEGLTLLGGEPFEQAEPLAELLRLAWAARLSTVVFTGFTHEQLIAMEEPYVREALAHTDVLIDGPYIERLRDFSRPMVGSANQRFIFLTGRYAMAHFKANRIEIRILPDGTTAINGMGHIEQLAGITGQQSIHTQPTTSCLHQPS